MIVLDPWEIDGGDVDSLFDFDLYGRDKYDSVECKVTDCGRSGRRKQMHHRRRSSQEACFDINLDLSSRSSYDSSTIDWADTGNVASNDSSSTSSVFSSESSSLSSSCSSVSSSSSSSESPLSSSFSFSPSTSFVDRSFSPSLFSCSPEAPPSTSNRWSSESEKKGSAESYLGKTSATIDGRRKVGRKRVPNTSTEEHRKDDDDDEAFEYVECVHLFDFLDTLYHRPEVASNKKCGSIFGTRNATRVAEETPLDDVYYVNFDDGSFSTNVDATNRRRERNEKFEKSTSTLGILGPDEKIWTIEAIRTSVALADSSDLHKLSKLTLKKLLLRLHPDKNQNSNDLECRSLFEKVYRAYSEKR